ncbi:DUF3379 domain-containing protein [Wenzhouxiangella sp. XN79A]|uniref:DUF3379 family protein n=1 Tax=Wenzhouxiangella sp. XN79A TaxID=2724193 RepID=UPI00144A8EBF|nr:DUF3379 family protein [Wenzhouxiangella sp. XN79A]NKI33560.1 DUF3379 domain-containing protein [Wenzhouxiangella sp. XN79A]
MNLDELQRRLMTDPAREREAAAAARASGGEAARAVEESDAFERLLGEAMNVAPPDDLQHQLRQVPFRAGRRERRGPGAAGWLAMAASLTLAVAVTLFLLRDAAPPADGGLAAHLAWHWDHDGPTVLAAARTGPTPPARVQELLADFGVALAPELLADVRLSKICPTPDGAGAHLVLSAPDGPVTLYYMPHTVVPASGESYPLADDMRAWVFNVERGSVALVGDQGSDLPALGQRIAAQLVFQDDRSL